MTAGPLQRPGTPGVVTMSIKMELCRVLIRETDDTHVVELREAEVPEDQARVFPIVIGLTGVAYSD